MHNTALTHLDGVATSVGAEAWGRRYIVVRVRRPRGGCSCGGAAAATLSLRPDEAVQHLTLISHLLYSIISTISSAVVVVVSAKIGRTLLARAFPYNINY